jgi:hypothetical protein
LILLGFAELDHRDLILKLLLDAANRADLILERRAFLHHALRALLIAPEIWIFSLSVELRKTRTRLVEVKDASSAAQPTA